MPYDMPIIGYGTENIGKLRLWQSDAVNEFNFELFNNCEYDEAIKEKTEAEIYQQDYIQMIIQKQEKYYVIDSNISLLVHQFKIY